MAIITVGPTSTYPSIASAMLAAAANDTIVLEAGYGGENATVTQDGLTLDGTSSSTGINLQLGSGVTGFTLTGAAPINVVDSAGPNDIVGNAGSNVIRVAGGADHVSGGAGDDTLIIDYSASVSAVTMGAPTGGNGQAADLEGRSVTYDGIENFRIQSGSANDTITTGAGNDVISGGGGNDIIHAGAGNDFLFGDAGADTMYGGPGNDTYTVTEAGDAVIELAGEGVDTVYSSLGSYTLTANVENLILLGSAIAGTGNELGNFILGNNQANTIIGGAGADTMVGGAGNDTYEVTDTGDIVTEVPGEGTDVVFSYLNSYTLTANVENLVLGGNAVTGIGNDLGNYIFGNDHDNVILGGVGADIMVGGAGNDVYEVDNIGDIVYELAGQGTADNVFAYVDFTLAPNVDNLIMQYGNQTYGYGNDGDNIIIGNAQANVIQGGGGYDTLTGGAGSDLFIVAPNWGVDVITDFTAGAGTEDAVIFSSAIFSSFDQVMAHSAQVGNDVYIGDGYGDTVVLLNVNQAALHSNDFGFF